MDLVYPPSCIACGAALAEHDGICPACWRLMPLITQHICDRYGTPLPVDHGGMMRRSPILPFLAVHVRLRGTTVLRANWCMD